MPRSGEAAARPRRRSVETRLGTTFVLLMQVRVLVVGVTALADERVRADPWALGVLGFAALVSGALLAGWERVVPRLAEQPALLAFDVLVGYAVLRAGGVLGLYFLVTVVAAGLAGMLYRWPVTALLCAQQTVLYYTALYQTGTAGEDVSLPLLYALPVFYALGALVGGVLRRLVDEQAAAEERQRRMEAEAMAAEERTRLAREMHDSLTATLAGIALSATGLPAWVRKSPDRAESEARRIATAARVAAGEARSLIAELRADAGLPLGEAVRRTAAEWERSTGVPVRVAADPAADAGADADAASAAGPPPRARHELLTIVKEALENVRRHADASRVEIEVAPDPAGGGLRLRVRDDGRGLPEGPGGAGWLDGLAGAGHYGIVGMHERAERAGGRLEVSAAPGGGTVVTVWAPVDGTGAEPAPAALGRG